MIWGTGLLWKAPPSGFPLRAPLRFKGCKERDLGFRGLGFRV